LFLNNSSHRKKKTKTFKWKANIRIKITHTLIAVPTNDEVTIFPKMLGMADKMFIYELNGEKPKLLEKRNNPYAKTQQHLKTLDVYDLLHDCAIIISAHIGKKGISTPWKKRGVKTLV